jgi:hypothetical protein
MELKTCTKCKQIKPLFDFTNDKTKIDGISSNCKLCKKAWKDANKQRIAKYHEDWIAKNADRKSQLNKVWNENNKEKKQALKNSWDTNNHDMVVKNSAKRRAAELQRTVGWSNEQDIAMFYEIAEVLSRGGVKFHVDHEIPLRGKLVSGLHVETNLQVLPWHLNISKGNRYEAR